MATLHEKAQAQRIVELETALAAARAKPKQPGFTAADMARREDEEMRKLMQCVDKANSVLAFVFVHVVSTLRSFGDGVTTWRPARREKGRASTLFFSAAGTARDGLSHARAERPHRGLERREAARGLGSQEGA